MTAEPENAYAALYNPALVAAQSHSLFEFSSTATASSYRPLGLVLVDTPGYRTAQGVLRSEEYRLPDNRLTLWAAGLTYPFSTPWREHRGGVALAFSGPFDRIRKFSAGTPYDFSSLRYGASDAQFKGTFSVGLELVPEFLYFGTGLSLFITGAGSADAAVVSTNPTGRLAVDVALNTSLIAGVFLKRGKTQGSLVFRQAVNPVFTQQFTGRVQLGGTDVLQQPVLLRSSLYYEPQLWEIDVQRQFAGWKASVGVSYQHWADYQPSYLILETVDSGGTPHRAALPALSLRDTLNPRASAEIKLASAITLCAGYQFRPTPIPDISGVGNLLDSDTHIAALSLSFLWADSWLDRPLTLSAFGQFHWLSHRDIRKSAGDFVGAPQYSFSGHTYLYGLSVRASL